MYENSIIGMWIEGNKLVTLVRTTSTVNVDMLPCGEGSVRDLKYIEKEFPNLIQRFTCLLKGDGDNDPDTQTRA